MYYTHTHTHIFIHIYGHRYCGENSGLYNTMRIMGGLRNFTPRVLVIGYRKLYFTKAFIYQRRVTYFRNKHSPSTTKERNDPNKLIPFLVFTYFLCVDRRTAVPLVRFALLYCEFVSFQFNSFEHLTISYQIIIYFHLLK